MNIAVFSHYFSPEIGAPSARIYDLAQQWLLMGHEVQVVTCFPNHPAGRLYPGYKSGFYLREKLSGIDVHRHWTYITPNKGFLKKTLGHISYLPSALWLSNRHLAKPDVAIGTSPTFFAAMAAARAGRKFRVPFIMEIRDLWPAIFVELGVLKNPRLIRLLEMWELSLYRRASRVVTVTEAFRRDLIRRGVPQEKVLTISNGADEAYWQPVENQDSLRRKLGLDGRFMILYIGAHGISQALTHILKSAERLAAQPGLEFIFVGDGAEKEALMRYAREKDLRNVRFLDPVDKEAVKTYYGAADVCLVPLRNIPLFDTFIPSKMFEMMAMARPIVASVRGEAAEILHDSGGALVVEPEDSAGIAEAILRLYRDPAEAKFLGERGRKFVVENYSRRSLAEKYLGLMREAIGQESAPKAGA